MYHRDALTPIVAFLRGIGFEVVCGDSAHGGFLPGVNIRAGAIHLDPDTLVGSGDLLHEAGHLAVVPARFRSRMGSDIQRDLEGIIAEEGGPDTQAGAALAHVIAQGEFMAQAWSYAAALHLGVPPAAIFFPGAYKFTDYEGDHPMQRWLEHGTHYGPLHLAKLGMTGYSGTFSFMGSNGMEPFPRMSRWLVD